MCVKRGAERAATDSTIRWRHPTPGAAGATIVSTPAARAVAAEDLYEGLFLPLGVRNEREYHAGGGQAHDLTQAALALLGAQREA